TGRRAPTGRDEEGGRAQIAANGFGGVDRWIDYGGRVHDPSSIPRRVVSRSLESRLVADATVPPAEFRRAVAALNAMHPRPELFVTALDAPPRLAPYTWAFSVEADAVRSAAEDLDEPDTSGRLILLHDPAGQDAWEGTFRLVC